MAKLSATTVAVFIGLLQIAVIFACNCELKHPQTQFKEANFVVKAKVHSKRRNMTFDDSSFAFTTYLEYRVEIQKIFKGRRRFTSNLVSMRESEESSCGIKSMKPGKKYLISGKFDDGDFYLDVCSWVEEWSELTKEQKTGLKSAYATKCRKCNVPSVSGPELVMIFVDPRAPPAIQELPSHLYSLSGLWANQPGNCTFNPVDSLQYPTRDCESQYTYCTESKQDGCGWLINNRYKECFIDRETAWAKRELRRASWGGSLQGRTIRVGGRRFGCSPNAPEDEFHQCMRREVAQIVTQFLRPN